MTLIARATDFIRAPNDDEYDLLLDCISDGGTAALAATQMLAEDMYDGFTFNFELKAPAALSLIVFGQAGLHALVEMAVRTPTSKNRSLCLSTLASVATGSVTRSVALYVREERLRNRIVMEIREGSMADLARAALREYVLGIEDETDAVGAIGGQLQTAGWMDEGDKFIGELFSALAARRLAAGPTTIRAFERLIAQQSEDEPTFHRFFERHPQLLDPAAAEVWSKPDIVGAREPDFVVRRTDDTYLVVEIEVPGKRLMTDANQLSAAATQAIAQATDYRAFLLERFPLAAKHFPRFSEPECLVVIGDESALSEAQRAALARDNRSRAGLRVVGFDWIARRALAVSRNVTEPQLTTRSIRVI
jgi:hypothetical protein